MSKTALIATLLGFLAGVAGAAVVTMNGNDSDKQPDGVAESAPQQPVISFDSNASLEDRLSALEAAVSAERDARQLLEEEILALYDALDSPAAADSDDASETASAARSEARRGPRGGQRVDAAERQKLLEEAGFSPDRAAWIAQRSEELEYEAMRTRYDAWQSGEPRSANDWPASSGELLRNEIGEAEYEQYLEANGRPTAVNISRVMASSPAQTAGLQPGDQITHYNGERVYSAFDLTRQTMRGESGQSVVVEIMRDGTPMQVTMPRGPLGINSRIRR